MNLRHPNNFTAGGVPAATGGVRYVRANERQGQ